MTKITKFITAFLILTALSADLNAQLVQVGFSGSLGRVGYAGEIGPVDKYQDGDTLTGQLIYDTDLLIGSECTDEVNWNKSYQSDNAILYFSMSITRAGVAVTSLPNVLLSYPNQSMVSGVNALIHHSDQLTEQYFWFYMQEVENAELIYPKLKNYIEITFMTSEQEYTSVPFWPSRILDPENYWLDKVFRIWSEYWSSASESESCVVYDFTLDSVAVTIIPEPATLALLVLGGSVLRRKR